MNKEPLMKTELDGLRLFKRGKVRDIYTVGDDLLIVSTDRISCFDVVLPTGIPYKGEVLTALSVFWFEFTKDIIPNHFITDDVSRYPNELVPYKEILEGRSMLVKKTTPIPVECVVRGYLSGSGWRDYKKNHSICGIRLPNGLKESDRLPEPLFTPASKETEGHDVNVTMEYIKKEVGNTVSQRLREVSIALYTKAAQYAESKGIIIADTKFEFGWRDNEIILIDEILTPDSSRFWPKNLYKPGRSQPSFDKQFVRDYLEALDWTKTPPGPDLPDEIVNKTSQKYLQALTMITGKKIDSVGLCS